jgi:hypothetical protein
MDGKQVGTVMGGYLSSDATQRSIHSYHTGTDRIDEWLPRIKDNRELLPPNHFQSQPDL